MMGSLKASYADGSIRHFKQGQVRRRQKKQMTPLLSGTVGAAGVPSDVPGVSP